MSGKRLPNRRNGPVWPNRSQLLKKNPVLCQTNKQTKKLLKEYNCSLSMKRHQNSVIFLNEPVLHGFHRNSNSFTHTENKTEMSQTALGPKESMALALTLRCP